MVWAAVTPVLFQIAVSFPYIRFSTKEKGLVGLQLDILLEVRRYCTVQTTE